MIKALILDVDGVLIGSKKGYNWPDPNPAVIETLKMLNKRGIHVTLCTGKGTFAIENVVKMAELDGIHIGDGGAIVMNVMTGEVIVQHIIEKSLVKKVVSDLLEKNIYIELYTKDGYYVQENFVGDKTRKHGDILYKEPKIVPSILDIVDAADIVKIMPVANDENQKNDIKMYFKEYQDTLTLQWGVHPTALPYQFGIITVKGISKSQAAQVISDNTKVSLVDTLGIGDSLTDWQFLEICGYAGAMGNASQELKEKVITKGDYGYIGKSVDENGVVDIARHFGLTT